MATSTSPTVGGRIVTAFFDTEGAAKKAMDDIVAAGIPRQHISRTGGLQAEAEDSTHADDKGFWDSLKDIFLPDEDRHVYAEGLRRGGYLVKVRTEEANYNRVLDIIDTDGAVDMDGREDEWTSSGWSRPAASDPLVARDVPATGLAAGKTLSAGATAPAIRGGNVGGVGPAYASTLTTQTGTDTVDWRRDEAARAAALDGSVPATVAAARSVRDDSHGRARLRTYRVDDHLETSTVGPFSALTDASRIVAQMEVISVDGHSIGTVDHLDGPDRIKLTRKTSPDGQHHYVPFSWIDHVDEHVHLRKTLGEIKAQQSA